MLETEHWREEGPAWPQSPHLPTALCAGDDDDDGGDDEHLLRADSVPGRPHIKCFVYCLSFHYQNSSEG